MIQRGLSSPGFAEDKGGASYGVRVALQDYLRAHGRTNEEVKTHLRSIGVDTLKRYDNF